MEHASFELAIEARNSRCDIVVMGIWIGQHVHIKSDPRQVGVLTAARHSIEGQVRAYLNPSRGISGKERAPSRSQPTSQELKWEESGRARKGPSSSSKSILAISIAEAVGDSKSRTLKPRSTRPAACLPAQLAYVEVAIFGLIAQ